MLTAAFVSFGLAFLMVQVWLAVICVRFLRSGRRAFDRYVIEMNRAAQASRPHAPSPHAPMHHPETER